VFLAPSSSRTSQSFAYNPTTKGILEQVWQLNTDIAVETPLISMYKIFEVFFLDRYGLPLSIGQIAG